MNVELLTQIAEWLEAGAPEASFGYKFNMADYFSGVEKPHCGTTCCIAGAAMAIVGDTTARYGTPGGAEQYAANILGLDVDQAYTLFYAYGRQQKLVEIKPDCAARVVRHLIATGNVDWTV